MLSRVSVVPPPGAFWSPLALPIMWRDGNGVFVEGIDGLEPVTATINTTPYNFLDGEYENGSSVGKRNIVLHLVMEPGVNGSIAQLRRGLYGYFMPQTPVTLQFDGSDQVPVQIDGVVESFEHDRFTNDPKVTISILCPMPNFRSTSGGYATDSCAVDPAYQDIVYSGDRIVGFNVKFTNYSAYEISTNIQLERRIESSPGVYYSTQIFKTHSPVTIPRSESGYLYLDTRAGLKKFETRDTSDNRINTMMGYIDDSSFWPVLYVADNKVRVITDSDMPMLMWALSYSIEYGGI